MATRLFKKIAYCRKTRLDALVSPLCLQAYKNFKSLSAQNTKVRTIWAFLISSWLQKITTKAGTLWRHEEIFECRKKTVKPNLASFLVTTRAL